MLLRSVTLFVLLLLASTVTAATIFPLPDEQITVAVAALKEKNYRKSLDAAVKAPQSGARDFVIGVASYRLQEWEGAASYFAHAADAFPLLADFSLFHAASALYRLDRYSSALNHLQRLTREYPESPLSRQAMLMTADILFDSRNFREAQSAYQKFVEKFPSGTDSLTATYKSALCQEQIGDDAGSASSLRKIWLKYPASSVATEAEKDLRRLAGQGVAVEPFSTNEILNRGVTLFDLKRYKQAAAVFQGISSSQLTASSSAKYLFKLGQAQFRARRHGDAAQTFRTLLGRQIDRNLYEEAYFWLGMALARSNRDEDAFAVFMKLAEFATSPQLASKALHESAYIRKSQNRINDAISLLKKIAVPSGDAALKQGITWEIAWWSFLAGDMKTAGDYLAQLTTDDGYREKALYWLGRALATAGDKSGSQTAYSRLLSDFPLGFYAQSYRTEMNLKGDDISLPVTNLCEILPMPAGFDRAKALITFGLFDEARRELALSRKKLTAKNGSLPGLARLYLEMDDFNGAHTLLKNERPQKFEKDKIYQWGLCYPLAFREHVAKLAEDLSLPEGLVYAVIRAESAFSPTALSPAGAVGLMQLMPSTAASMANGTKNTFNADTLTEPKTNIRYGVRHLKDLLVMYKGDVVLAVAAYNAGSGNVSKWRKAFGHLRKDEFIENIPFAETREYVKKVISGAEIYDRLYRLAPPSVKMPATPPQINPPQRQELIHQPPDVPA